MQFYNWNLQFFHCFRSLAWTIHQSIPYTMGNEDVRWDDQETSNHWNVQEVAEEHLWTPASIDSLANVSNVEVRFNLIVQVKILTNLIKLSFSRQFYIFDKCAPFELKDSEYEVYTFNATHNKFRFGNEVYWNWQHLEWNLRKISQNMSCIFARVWFWSKRFWRMGGWSTATSQSPGATALSTDLMYTRRRCASSDNVFIFCS